MQKEIEVDMDLVAGLERMTPESLASDSQAPTGGYK